MQNKYIIKSIQYNWKTKILIFIKAVSWTLHNIKKSQFIFLDPNWFIKSVNVYLYRLVFLKNSKMDYIYLDKYIKFDMVFFFLNISNIY